MLPGCSQLSTAPPSRRARMTPLPLPRSARSTPPGRRQRAKRQTGDTIASGGVLRGGLGRQAGWPPRQFWAGKLSLLVSVIPGQIATLLQDIRTVYFVLGTQYPGLSFTPA